MLKNKLLSIDKSSNWFGKFLKVKKQDIMSLEEISLTNKSENDFFTKNQIIDLSDYKQTKINSGKLNFLKYFFFNLNISLNLFYKNLK